MKRDSLAAGVGGIAFAVLTMLAVIVANPPGGTYSANDAADFVTKGHRAAVFVSLYLVLLAGVGLLLLLARLRDAITAGGRLASVFWGLSIGAVTAWVVGYALIGAVPLAMAYGGSGVTIAPTLTYIFSEAGWVIMLGAGGILLGAGLVTLSLTRLALPSWLRWFTLLAGICAVAAPAWFPMFVVLLWALVAGIWTLAADRSERLVAQPA